MPIFRYVVFGATLFMAVIVLGTASDFLSTSERYLRSYYYFTPVAIAAAAVTLITLPIMIVVDMTRKGAFTSRVIVELVWLTILWVFWLSTASYTAWADSVVLSPTCDYFNSIVQRGCNEWKTVMAFSFLIWLTLMGYTITLLIFAIIGANRGNAVWSSSVSDNLFLTPVAGGTNPYGGKVEVPTGYQPTGYGEQYPSNHAIMAGAYPPSTPSNAPYAPSTPSQSPYPPPSGPLQAPYPPSSPPNGPSQSPSNGGYIPTTFDDAHQYSAGQSPAHDGYHHPVPMSVSQPPQV
ncbi:hypothetical protein JAAARDRAFT_28698 [Jaapia argillacea MUCL 33604]|uniref:MARVEL domain-containing protein n=1 Tax=Jaapia argillacea MUCL 33604 TaxID=933084 RepID=A0A067QNB3_9AGAM|nr:hypothetical protein JAAARDRAFT_28698 [Jaapia argillacea MUCL 33604]